MVSTLKTITCVQSVPVVKLIIQVVDFWGQSAGKTNYPLDSIFQGLATSETCGIW